MSGQESPTKRSANSNEEPSLSEDIEDKKDHLSGSDEEDEEEFEEDFDPTSIPVNESLDTEHNRNLAQRSGLTRKTCEHRPNFEVTAWNDGLIYNYADEDNNPLWGEGIYYSLTPQLVENIKKASLELHQLCLKAVGVIVNNEKYLRQLCIPKNFWPLVRASWARKDFHIYGRFDLGIPCDVNESPKLFEYNADTPIMLLESTKLQRQWANEVFGSDAKQFNDIKENLSKRWIEIKPTLLSRLGWFRNNAKIHFTAVDDQEDMATLNILQQTASEAGFDTAHIEIKDIGWSGDCFKDFQNQKIELLFKLYPWEWLIDEGFSDHLAKDKVIIMEPIWKLILSNKALLPILWELFPNHPNLLPAYFEEDQAKEHLSECGYIRKPIFGRQGDNVTIYKNNEKLLETEELVYMEETQKVEIGKWQRLPSIPIEHEISIGQRTVLYRGKIYAIFGASSQIFINCYDIELKSWCQLDTNEEENLVQKSQYHSLVVHNNRIYMFAGTQLIGGEFYLVNRICYLDMNTHVWHKIDAKGTLPEPMYLHSGVVYENCLYTFGGKLTHEGNDCINKVYKFDFETETWTDVEAKGDIPSPRRAHGAAVYEDSMYIFGGWNGVQTFGDFYKFDFETSTWSQIEVNNGPQARQLDSMAQYGGKLYLYGGEGGKKYLNDFWSYDIENNEWTEITDDGKLVDFGRYANALVLDDNVMYLVGGSGAQALDDLYSITLPVVYKEHKPKTLFEKLQHDMRTLRLGQSAAFDFSVLSKKKNLAVQGHKVIYAARAPALMKLFHEQGHYTVDLSKKLINGLSEWIYEDKITAIEKYSLEHLHELLEFAIEYEIGGLIDLIECEMMERLDPEMIFDVDYSIATPRIRKMCRWIFHHNEDEYEEISAEFQQVFDLIELPTSTPSTDYTHTLSRDLLRIRKMTEYSDVIVKANDAPLNLHLLMVNLRFPYFKGLIGFGIKLSQSSSEGFVTHEHSLHIPFSAFNSIIDYVYSSEIIFEPQDYFPIASEASFYMIDDGLFYADMTEKFQQMITKENSKRLYEIAASYGSAFLDIMEYIASHYTVNE